MFNKKMYKNIVYILEWQHVFYKKVKEVLAEGRDEEVKLAYKMAID